jgi:NTP pyrophosphatase (non-canonical NTP hydrolase)
MIELEKAISLALDQMNNRRTWQEHDTPENLAKGVRDEAQELVDAIDQFDVLQDAEYSVVGEIGDVLLYTIKLCALMGINPMEAIKYKLERNAVKYPDHFSSNGWNREISVKMSKSFYKSIGGDHVFNLWHSENIEDL